jgi:tRNA (cytidine/uridine-2'-O-)-methyltransferase
MASRIRLALYEPDIPQNTGALLRLAACLDVPVDIIFPLGFVWDDRRLRRSGMDYLKGVDLARHDSWEAFLASPTRAGRLVLLTTRAAVGHVDFMFRPDDTLILGRESAGADERVHAAAHARLRVPMRAGMRSLNVAVAAAIVLGEALRQTKQYPGQTP